MKIRLANFDDASNLINLYCKALKVAAMDKYFCAAKNRNEAIEWLQGTCQNRKISVAHDGNLPFALLHYEPERNEIITVVVQDNMERQGVATKLIQNLQKREKSLKAIPVTPGGKALLRSCKFVENDKNHSHWSWKCSL